MPFRFVGHVYTYYDNGLVKTQTDPNGLTLTYAYDKDGNVVNVADSLGGQVASYYDNADRLTSRQFSGPNGQQARLDLTYTPDGQVATLTRYADLLGTIKVGLTLFAYDNAGNTVQVQHFDGFPLSTRTRRATSSNPRPSSTTSSGSWWKPTSPRPPPA